MFNDKGYIKFKDDDYQVTINYLNQGDYLVGITLGDSNKVKYFADHPYITATDGPKGTEFVKVEVEIDREPQLARSIYDQMSVLNHNHFKQYDQRLVTVKVKLI